MEALWAMTRIIEDNTARKKHVYACACDTKMAYDGVWRDGLWFNLYTYGVRGKMLRMVIMWHEGAKGEGQWYDKKSQAIEFTQGLRQGCYVA